MTDMRRLKVLCAATAFAIGAFGHSTAARAWGPEGHVIVAVIAKQILEQTYPNTWKKAHALLQADKDVLTARDFASRSNWADEEKKRNYAGTHNWHFAEIEIMGGSIAAACKGHTPPGWPASRGPANACIVDKIEEFRTELAKPQTPRAERVLALKYLLHFVGDIHQPLHAADNFDDDGNDIMVIRPTGGPDLSLHLYWNVALVGTPGISFNATAAHLMERYRAKFELWADGGPYQWAMESHALAVKYAYGRPIGLDRVKGGPPVRLTEPYQTNAQRVVDEQLVKAGVRLAMVLAQALP
jgi:hypothetical protein